ISCNSVDKNTTSNIVKINGSVENFQDYTDEFTRIEIIVNDIAIADQVNYSSFINKKGEFKIEFPMYNSQDIFLSYANNLVTIFIEPGNNLNIKLNADLLADGIISNKSIVFFGLNAEINNILIDYVPKFFNNMPREDWSYDKKIQELNPENFRNYTFKRMKSNIKFLQKYIEKNEVPVIFKQWANFQIKYSCAQSLFRYTWQHPRKNGIEYSDFVIPDSYFSFINTFDINNEEAVISSNYAEYLNEYDLFLYEKKVLPYGQKNKKLLFEKNFEVLRSLSNGYGRDVLITQLFMGQLDRNDYYLIEPFLEQYQNIVKNPILIKRVNEQYEKVTKAADYPESSNSSIQAVPENLNSDSLLTSILNKHKGKVIYIDFWAVWCGNCLHEMVASNNLRNEFLKQDVAFLYICVLSSEAAWKAKINQYKIHGDNYLLSSKQHEIFKAIFGITGYPHYALIDKNGIIVDKKSKRPSGSDYNTINSELVKEINSLL
ncbi:TlpA family protein disulfide reductase, partial [candidate division KSB1 bacterium]|nr:TlpA family protein disulfide reductase [candidate division KSB1 bacterium]